MQIQQTKSARLKFPLRLTKSHPFASLLSLTPRLFSRGLVPLAKRERQFYSPF